MWCSLDMSGTAFKESTSEGQPVLITHANENIGKTKDMKSNTERPHLQSEGAILKHSNHGERPIQCKYLKFFLTLLNIKCHKSILIIIIVCQTLWYGN